MTTLEKEVKTCTFRPKVNKKQMVASTPKVRGYEQVISRMRQASMEKELLQSENSPVRQYRRYTDSKPFSFLQSQKKEVKSPMMYLDIVLGPER